jgi:hypothetical protein
MHPLSCKPVGATVSGLGRLVGIPAERPDEIHEIPADFFLGAVALAADHFSPAVGDDVEERAIGVFGDAGGVAPVVQFELHLFG